MSPARLLEHFDRLIDTPDAVPRLRRFILDLAVRGKLVEQDPKDEPARELLKRITKEKARQIKEGSLRQQETRVLVEEDAPFDLPAGWMWTQLAEVGVINPRCEAADSTAASFVPMPMISAKYGRAHEHEIRRWAEIKKGFTQFAEGDVGLAKITPCFENGKSTVFRGLTGGLGAGTTELHVLRPVFVSADYILVFLKSSHFIETGIPKMTGTAGQKRVSRDYFAFSPVPLPPLAEQHRIVAKLDELMALCDELEAAQTKREKRRDRLVAATLHGLNNGDATPTPGTPSTFEESARFYFNHLARLTTRPEHIHQLRQTILNLAVRGKLVPQDVSPADPLAKLRQFEWRGDNLDVCYKIPDSWVRIEVSNLLCEKLANGLSVPGRDMPPGIPALKLNAITSRCIDDTTVRFLPITQERAKSLFLKRGDFLLARGNGSRDLVARGATVIREPPEPTIFPDTMIRVRLNAFVSVDWFKHVWNSQLVRMQIEKMAKTAVGLWKISQEQVSHVVIALPPLNEQNRIVAKVDELLALCEELEAGQDSSTTTSQQLLETTLLEALA